MRVALDNSILTDYVALALEDTPRAPSKALAWLTGLVEQDDFDLVIPAVVLQEAAAPGPYDVHVQRALEHIADNIAVLDFDAEAALEAAEFQRIAQGPKMTKAQTNRWFRDGAIVGSVARHRVERLVTYEAAWKQYAPRLLLSGCRLIVAPQNHA